MIKAWEIKKVFKHWVETKINRRSRDVLTQPKGWGWGSSPSWSQAAFKIKQGFGGALPNWRLIQAAEMPGVRHALRMDYFWVLQRSQFWYLNFSKCQLFLCKISSPRVLGAVAQPGDSSSCCSLLRARVVPGATLIHQAVPCSIFHDHRLPSAGALRREQSPVLVAFSPSAL